MNINSILGSLKKIVFFCLFFLLLSIPHIPLVYSIAMDRVDSATQIVLALIILLLIGLIAFFLIKRYKSQLLKENSRHINNNKLDRNSLYLTIVMLMLLTLVQYLWGIVQVEEPLNQQVIQATVKKAPLALFPVAVIGAPVLEELIFRGIFFNYFFNKNIKLYNFMAVFCSGLLFGAIHEFSLSPSLLMYSTMGWIFGFTYLYTKNIKTSIFLHAVNNLAGFILSVLL